MTTLTYPTPKYVVLHGHAVAPVVLIAYEPPSKISTGQPNVEPFDDPQDAIDRAIELGVPPLLTSEFWLRGQAFNFKTKRLVTLPDPIPEYDAEHHYHPGDVVLDADGNHWLKISDAQGSPDEVFDLQAGTGDWVPFHLKPAPPPPTAEQRLEQLEARLAPPPPIAEQRLAQLEARLAALEST